MKRLIIFLFITFSFAFAKGNWFDRNKELEVIFPDKVWKFIEKADLLIKKGRVEDADYCLRVAKHLTDQARPFKPADWPKGWPKDEEAMKFLKYATPDAYIDRIIGDYAYSQGKNKEAIKYFHNYLQKSIIPDSSYMMKLATIYEMEGLWKDALILYRDLLHCLETENFHGTKYSANYVMRKMKNIELKIKKPWILVLDVSFMNVPPFLHKDFSSLFSKEIKNCKKVRIIPEESLIRIMEEEKLTLKDLENEDELSRIGKMLNASYVVKSILAKANREYIFQVRIFNVDEKKWFEDYEYKTEDFRNFPNYIKRFVYEFENEKIPEDLWLPFKKIRWNYETDGEILSLKISKGCERIICGCESGSVYIFNRDGKVLKRFRMKDRIVKVGVSPDGKFFAWGTLEGKIYFTDLFTLKSKKIGNLIRGIGICKNGKFFTFAVNNRVYYADRKGEIFWEREFPFWVSAVEISQDGRDVYIGGENGEIVNINEEGNIVWSKRGRNKIIRIKFSPDEKFLSFEDIDGNTVVFDRNARKMAELVPGSEKKFTSFSSELLQCLTGKRGNFFYFLSPSEDKVWKYEVERKVSFIESTPKGKEAIAAEGKNLFFISIEWK